MAKQILTLTDLGYEGAWLLVQQACGIPDARARSTFLENTTTVLFFAQDSLPERLCITAAARQMGGHVVYVGPGPWSAEVRDYPHEMNRIASYYIDVIYTYGMPLPTLRRAAESPPCPVLNGGSPESHPVNALADIACMQQYTPDLGKVTMAWVGCANGTLCSLIEATEYFPYSLRIALPPGSPAPDIMRQAEGQGRKVCLCQTPEEAVRGAHYISAGCLGEGELPTSALWRISGDLLRHADDRARILLSASPGWSTPIESELLQSKVSLLSKQGENRLRVNKRVLHLLMGE